MYFYPIDIMKYNYNINQWKALFFIYNKCNNDFLTSNHTKSTVVLYKIKKIKNSAYVFWKKIKLEYDTIHI